MKTAAAAATLLAACSGEATGGDGGAPPDDAGLDRAAEADALFDAGDEGNAPCEDRDGDGYGRGLACRGPDCDDGDRSVTSGCYDCTPPARGAGCACEPGAAPLPCDVNTGWSHAGPGGFCFLGQRDCEPRDGGAGWAWGACRRWRENFRHVGAISPCPGSCLPTCRHQLVCHVEGDPLPAGAMNLRVASRRHAVFCPPGTPPGGLTVACAPGGARCASGVYARVFEGDCTPPTDSPTDPFRGSTPYWGQFNFSSDVPVGTAIRFEVRAADTVAALATARVVRLPDAELGAPLAPTSFDLRANLRLGSTPTDPLYLRRYVQVTAYLDPTADGSIAPTLISMEAQYTCFAGD